MTVLHTGELGTQNSCDFLQIPQLAWDSTRELLATSLTASPARQVPSSRLRGQLGDGTGSQLPKPLAQPWQESLGSERKGW